MALEVVGGQMHSSHFPRKRTFGRRPPSGIARVVDPATGPDASSAALRTPGTRDASRLRDLTLHLAKRELDMTHRMTALGWAWPLVRQLAQLAVLVFIFSHALDLGIENYPVFVFTGLVGWSWFAAGLTAASSSLVAQRHLLFQARFPTAVLPLVAVTVPFVDVLLALPVLIVLVAAGEGVPWTIVLAPAVLALQFVLMAGIAWIVAAASVFLRDIPNLVGVALMLLFYLTPVFYGVRNLPEQVQDVLRISPLTTIVEAYRAVLLQEPAPSATRLAVVCVFAIALAGVGFTVFHRVEQRFVDYL